MGEGTPFAVGPGQARPSGTLSLDYSYVRFSRTPLSLCFVGLGIVTPLLICLPSVTRLLVAYDHKGYRDTCFTLQLI